MKGSAGREGLGPYFSRLETALDALDSAALADRIRDYARRLDAADRRALLSVLEAPPEADRVGDGGPVRQAASDADAASVRDAAADADTASDPDAVAERLADDPLLGEIDAFVERLEGGHYYHGWGWDPELRDERAWGDESWAEEMDDFFAEAEHAYLSGDLPVAAEAYRALLEAFLLEEGPAFCGPLPPAETVTTDVAMAKARYFGALYQLSPPGRRPGALLAAMEKLRWVGEDEVGLEAVADADAHPLPDFDELLTAWIGLLEAQEEREPGSGYGWGRTRKWLLREAVRLRGGEEGLAELARRRGASDPEAFHEWIDGLAGAGRWREALAAALEGVEVVEDPPDRGRLADAAAALAGLAGEPDQALRMRRRAWRTEPTGRRLLALAAALEAAVEEVDSKLEDERKLAAGGELEATWCVLGALELLTGRYDEAAARLGEAPPLGWSRGGHPGYVVFPALLVAGAGTDPPEGSLMEAFWEGITGALRGSPFGYPRFPARGRDRRGEEGEADGVDMRRLLRAVLERSPPEETARRRLLDAAEAAALARTRAIVSNKHRGAYERAARVAGAAAEAWRLVGEEARAEALVVGLRREFSRFYAFTGELRGAVADSPLLRRLGPMLE